MRQFDSKKVMIKCYKMMFERFSYKSDNNIEKATNKK